MIHRRSLTRPVALVVLVDVRPWEALDEVQHLNPFGRRQAVAARGDLGWPRFDVGVAGIALTIGLEEAPDLSTDPPTPCELA